ncbi:MAG TPA: diaminopimelate decarboxylase [Terriglobales bacterium]|nr:diaminopimelate decarboxylase [Terriglobales bacterium]
MTQSLPFHYRRSALHCEQVPLARLAHRFGTPLYVYSRTAIVERYRAFDRAVRSQPHTLCYSVKANSNLSLLQLLAGEGAGFDVVSGGELERVFAAAPRAARRTVFSGVGKTTAEMDLALRAGILLFNVESEAELELLAARATRLRKKARVALRVNPDVRAETHPYIATGQRQHKFGVPMIQARALYRRAAQEKYLEVAGVSVHIGSQILRLAPFSTAMRRVAALVRSLRADGHHIRYVDSGGGLGIEYRHSHVDAGASPALPAYARAILGPLRGLNVHLLLEPGRALVGPAGLLLARVLYRKSSGRRRFLVLDAAMNDLMRPALYGAYHEIVPAVLASPSRNEKRATRSFDVVGPICETGDIFARNRQLSPLQEGDLVALLDAGAYGMSLASNYNSRPRPAEVLVSGRSARLIRRRETARDLMRPELASHPNR